ncbi:MAG: hypothetical protein WCS99_20595 [Limisphaerales bacterium]
MSAAIGLSFGRFATTAIIERTSPAEPRAIPRNCASSVVVVR